MATTLGWPASLDHTLLLSSEPAFQTSPHQTHVQTGTLTLFLSLPVSFLLLKLCPHHSAKYMVKTNQKDTNHSGLPLVSILSSLTKYPAAPLESALSASSRPHELQFRPLSSLALAFEHPHSLFLHLQPCPIFNTETCIAISLAQTANFQSLPCTVKPWLTSLAWHPRSFTVYDPNLPSTIICHYLLLHPTPTNQPYHLTHGCLNLSAL